FVVRLGAPSHRLGALADPPVELRRLLEKFGLDPGRFSGRLPEVRPELARALRQKLASQGTPYPDLDDAALIDNLHVHVFPNVMFNIMLPGYWLFRARPHESDPNRMLFDFQEYERVPEDRPRPRPRHTRHRHGEVSLDAVLDQDARIMHEAQRGLRSSAAGPLRLGAQEGRLRHFHEVLARRTGPSES
ncbi:MAG TPA: SRPBCC family protein, partial [Polyangiaceae bacterium]